MHPHVCLCPFGRVVCVCLSVCTREYIVYVRVYVSMFVHAYVCVCVLCVCWCMHSCVFRVLRARVCVCIHPRACARAIVCTRRYVRVYVCVCVPAWTCAYVSLSVLTYVYVCVRACVSYITRSCETALPKMYCKL